MTASPPGRQAGVLRLEVLPGSYVVCKKSAGDSRSPLLVPGPLSQPELWSLSRSESETSLVCREGLQPPEFESEAGWRAMRVSGPLDFSLVGILSELTSRLAAANVPVFAISTFDTDYLLVKSELLAQATEALASAGHEIVDVFSVSPVTE